MCVWLAAAAAKSLQSCPTPCDPIDGSPPGSPVPGILQARTLEWVAISFSNAWKWKVKVKSLSCVRLLATPRTAVYQAPPPMGFSRQEYWSGLPLPSLIEQLKWYKCITLQFCRSWSVWLGWNQGQRNTGRVAALPGHSREDSLVTFPSLWRQHMLPGSWSPSSIFKPPTTSLTLFPSSHLSLITVRKYSLILRTNE